MVRGGPEWVTFLFTDLEGSTRLWERHADAMASALEAHDVILRDIIRSHDGRVFATGGDGLAAAFASAADGLGAAADAQRALRAHLWPDELELRVRMGVHTGTAHERGGDYFGPALNRTARIMSVGHGGQVLVSAAARGLAPTWDYADLGLHRLRDLLDPEWLSQLVVDGDDRAYPPIRSLDAFDHNLPIVRSTLVGREGEISEVIARLGPSTVTTLTGVGGVGKTRLALEVATRVLDRFDPVCFVDLSVLADEALVLSALTTALGLPAAEAAGGERAAALRVLAHRPGLVVLDNCEHLLDACAELIELIVLQSPASTVLATSREPIGVDAERVYRVPSLDADTAAALFVDRAVAAGAVMPATDERSVADICRQLDGIPLALELAAVRTSHLSVAEIATHLDERFQLLTGGRRRSRQRQQTLQAAMDWSFDLLDEGDRALLRATGVFVGSFTLAALDAVSGATGSTLIDRIGSLVDKSLVEAQADAVEATRYRLLETVRLYALDRLVEAGEANARRAAHAAWYANALPDLLGSEPRVRELHDLENHLAALEWVDEANDKVSVGRHVSRLAMRLDVGVWQDTERRYLERDDVAAALSDPDERSAYLVCSAWNANHLGDFGAQLRLAQRALEASISLETRLDAIEILANALSVVDPGSALALVEDALDEAPPGLRRRRVMARRLDALIMGGHLQEAAPVADELEAEWGAVELPFLDHILGRERPPPAFMYPLFDYRFALARALDAASHADQDGAVRHLLEAAALIERRPIALLERDLLLTAAAVSWHAGDVARAARLLAVQSGPGGGFVRTPSSWALYIHYRTLVRAELERDQISAIKADVAHEDVDEVLAAELDRLRGLLAVGPD